MKQHLYITEPGVIDSTVIEEMLGGSYTITKGDPLFTMKPESNGVDTIVIRSGTTIGSNIKSHFPHLKNIVRVGTGLDNVDLDFCKKNGIAVYNAAGANAEAVSEYVVAITLSVLRKLNQLTDGDVRDWNRFKFSGHGINEQTIGIIGFGNIGKLIYKKFEAFAPKGFMVYDPYVPDTIVDNFNVRLASLNELLQESSVVILQLPLLEETRHMINADKLSLLQDESVLINASRGGVVDEQAVITALEKRNFTYVADAVENEPHPRPALMNNPRIVITPHIASLTASSEDAMVTVAIQNFLDKRAVRL